MENLQNDLHDIAYNIGGGEEFTAYNASIVERGLAEIVELLDLIGDIAEAVNNTYGLAYGLDHLAIESARETVDDIRNEIFKVRFDK